MYYLDTYPTHFVSEVKDDLGIALGLFSKFLLLNLVARPCICFRTFEKVSDGNWVVVNQQRQEVCRWEDYGGIPILNVCANELYIASVFIENQMGENCNLHQEFYMLL